METNFPIAHHSPSGLIFLSSTCPSLAVRPSPVPPRRLRTGGICLAFCYHRALVQPPARLTASALYYLALHPAASSHPGPHPQLTAALVCDLTCTDPCCSTVALRMSAWVPTCFATGTWETFDRLGCLSAGQAHRRRCHSITSLTTTTPDCTLHAKTDILSGAARRSRPTISTRNSRHHGVASSKSRFRVRLHSSEQSIVMET